jgi:hypothetical protein
VLVYGDQAREGDPRAEIAALRTALDALEQPGPGIERHARLASLFIAASELAQGLADAAMARAGGDGRTPEQDEAAELLLALARVLLASWTRLAEPFPTPLDTDEAARRLQRLAALPLPEVVRLKAGEGYGFYALYPEGYAAAARRLSTGPEATVIGVRSIGLGLAAVAAAALDAAAPVSVRPVGHPFRRELALTGGLEAELRAGAPGGFVVVDEGPGLSGSSFGAVADALERLGAPPDRIRFLPGHAGDLGPEASEAHRARWERAERPCEPFESLLGEGAPRGQRLTDWFADLHGGGDEPLRDVSGGGWRALRYASEADWPAVDAYQERRKYLLQGERGTWLLKFSGLGSAGERGFDHARRLGEAGFSPPALALRYGFTATPWLEAAPLELQEGDRARFIGHLGAYLGWRAAHLPAPETAGAALPALLVMARTNAGEALGGASTATAPLLDPDRWAAAPQLRRCWTDNRLHRREWLALPDGRWLKTDGVDHAAGHDLIGAQDVAWDIAGAIVEFDLDESEADLLLASVQRSAPAERALVAILRPAYIAFQLGAFTMAASAHAGWPDEAARLRRTADAYRSRLAACLG